MMMNDGDDFTRGTPTGLCLIILRFQANIKTQHRSPHPNVICTFSSKSRFGLHTQRFFEHLFFLINLLYNLYLYSLQACECS